MARRFTAEAFNQLFEFPHFLAGLFGSQGAASEFRLLAQVSADTTERTKAPAPMPENESDRRRTNVLRAVHCLKVVLPPRKRERCRSRH